MKTKTLAAAIVAIIAASGAASGAGAQTVQAARTAQMPTTLTVSATAEVQAAPDLAEIGAGVVTQAAEAEPALRANSEKMVRVIAALRKAGVAERDVQTSGLSLQPQFRYDQNQPPVLTGFQASNRVQVTLRDLKRAGTVIDLLVREGANQIDGPSFRIANPDPLVDRARTEAVQKARARAELYASAAGMKVVRIASISEGFEQRPPMPLARMMASEASASPTPVAPGEVAMVATVTMTFELE